MARLECGRNETVIKLITATQLADRVCVSGLRLVVCSFHAVMRAQGVVVYDPLLPSNIIASATCAEDVMARDFSMGS